MRDVPVAHITSLGDGVERWKPLENAAIDRLRRVVPVPRCAATRHFWHSAGPVVPARALAPFVSGACRAGQKDAPWGCAAIAPAPAAQHAAPLLPADSERAIARASFSLCPSARAPACCWIVTSAGGWRLACLCPWSPFGSSSKLELAPADLFGAGMPTTATLPHPSMRLGARRRPQASPAGCLSVVAPPFRRPIPATTGLRGEHFEATLQYGRRDGSPPRNVPLSPLAPRCRFGQPPTQAILIRDTPPVFLPPSVVRGEPVIGHGLLGQATKLFVPDFASHGCRELKHTTGAWQWIFSDYRLSTLTGWHDCGLAPGQLGRCEEFDPSPGSPRSPHAACIGHPADDSAMPSSWETLARDTFQSSSCHTYHVVSDFEGCQSGWEPATLLLSHSPRALVSPLADPALSEHQTYKSRS
ncbi:hypothetical protein ACCO45_004144 [Purpureocillium lilacinum]|uniref:Uncharacterized protein n=1 Tax=Purpureocillium lilacinum TaxID=33203 RepID=A0ACC4E4P7_PURLI